MRSMEDARRSVPHDKRIRLEKIWDVALSDAGKGKSTFFYIGTPAEKLVAAIRKVLGRDAKIKRNVIDLGHVRHIHKRHGVNGEALKNQLPVTRETFVLIADILDNFDTVEAGHRTGGLDGVLIRKKYSDGNAVIVEAVDNKGSLMVSSYRIDK